MTTAPVVSRATTIASRFQRSIVRSMRPESSSGAREATGLLTGMSRALRARYDRLLSRLHKTMHVCYSAYRRRQGRRVERHRGGHGNTVETRPELRARGAAVRQPARSGAPAWARTASRRSAGARRCGPTFPTRSGTTGAGSSRNRVNDLAEIEQILNLTDEEREGLSARRTSSASTSRRTSLSLIDPDDPERSDPPPGHPARPRAGSLHGDDGGLARRGPPLPGAGPGPPLPGSRADAGHDPVRAATAATAPGRASWATRRRTSTRASTRRSSTTCAARRRCATC